MFSIPNGIPVHAKKTLSIKILTILSIPLSSGKTNCDSQTATVIFSSTISTKELPAQTLENRIGNRSGIIHDMEAMEIQWLAL